MPQAACPSCGAALTLPDHSPAVSFRCPSCQKVLRLNRRSSPAKPMADISHVPASSGSRTATPEEPHSPKLSTSLRLGESRDLPDRARTSSLISKARRQSPVVKVGIAIAASIVGTIVVCVLVFCMGRRVPDAAEISPANGRAGHDSTGKPAHKDTLSAFSETDPLETLRWLVKVNDIEPSRNAFVRQEREKARAAQMATIKGRRIAWPLPINSVTLSTLFFDSLHIQASTYYGVEGDRVDTTAYLRVVVYNEKWRHLDPDNAGPGQQRLQPIDALEAPFKHSGEAWVKQLDKGSRLTLHAVIVKHALWKGNYGEGHIIYVNGSNYRLSPAN